ncbi:MAG: DUF502 domain-containing protein [Sedimentisphaerales bacterium]|nr:DUF502 domain-containing protein [Sedimentisphaerales bacterium]
MPTIVTIWIFVWGYTFIQEKISIHINRGLVRLTMFSQGLEWGAEENEKIKQTWRKFWVDGWGSIAGFLIALIAVCIIGALFASVVGKTIWRMIDKFIMNTPVLSKVYPYVKQITDFLFAQEEQEKLPFSRVVAVEYPRKGIWSLGLVTGSGLTKVVENVRRDCLTVLIPTSPTPFTGFVIMVPKKQTIDLDMTIEEAFRFTVSGGVITPSPQRQVAALPKPQSVDQEQKI